MTDAATRNFGYLIAYLIPGFVVVLTVGLHSATVRTWLGTVPAESPTVGGFLYVTVASVAAGMTVSAIRWIVLDTIHHRTGVPRPAWDVSSLSVNLSAFQAFVEFHYRHYQFYGNTLVAIAIAIGGWSALQTAIPLHPVMLAIMATGVAVLFFVASRDALRKYYARTNALLPLHRNNVGEEPMVNGCHNEDEKALEQKSVTNEKPETPTNDSKSLGTDSDSSRQVVATQRDNATKPPG